MLILKINIARSPGKINNNEIQYFGTNVASSDLSSKYFVFIPAVLQFESLILFFVSYLEFRISN